MKVLCYVRPWSETYHKDLCAFAFPGAQIEYISDFLGHGTVKLAERFYAHYNNQDKVLFYTTGLEPITFEDVYLRCRLLRSLPKQEATKLCHAMWLAIGDIFDDVRPDFVLSITVDSYVIDLIRIQCTKKSIPFIGLVKCFINNYFRVSSRGEFTRLRKPTRQEVASVTTKLLEERYLPAFVNDQGTKERYMIRAWINQAKTLLRFIYFSSKRKIVRDRLCYHYWANQVIAKQWLSGGFHSYTGDRLWREKLKANESKPKVFVPLQFIPEATVDYWCPNVEMIDYAKILMEAVNTFADKGFLILVKEHPGIVGMRDYRLYKAISQHHNVIIIPPQLRANAIIPMCNCIFVWTGTVGFEAALRGIPVIHTGYPYYVSGDHFYGVKKIPDLPEVIDHVMNAHRFHVSNDEQLAMVEFVLSGCLPGNLLYKDWKGKDSEKERYLAKVKQVGESIQLQFLT